MIYEIALTPEQQIFTVDLVGKLVKMRFLWNDSEEGGWTLDIYDIDDNPMIMGIPLVAGVDLLAQYFYMGFGGFLYVTTNGDWRKPPTIDNLGLNAHLLWEPF